MVFTTQIFLFIFFPLCVLIYFLADKSENLGRVGDFFVKIRLKDLVLIGFSFGFYAWACFNDIFWFILYILTVYLFARIVENAKKKRRYISVCSEETDVPEKRFYFSVIPLVISVFFVLLCLVYYKYFNFLSGIINTVFDREAGMKAVLAPLGLSFITFSAVSYLIDIYRGKASAGSLLDCALFLSFFPKVVSGPIVLWRDFQKQIGNRSMTLNMSSSGIQLITIGFAKKVLLADTFGSCLSSIGLTGIDSLTAAGTLILYMLQIYYDFSGYSDIAIGTAKIFGFEFKANFCYPYRSVSISEFWRRWHISLGTWFRESVYFPLGGSREGLKKTLRNLGVVFLLTGIWHGAGWNYILWGISHGVCVIVERVVKDKPVYQRIPDFVKWICTMLIVMILWQCFRFQNLGDIVSLMKILFGMADFDYVYYTWQYYFDAQIITLVSVGILGATVWGHPEIQKRRETMVSSNVGYVLQWLLFLILFLLAVITMVSSNYSPFIYFQY